MWNSDLLQWCSSPPNTPRDGCDVNCYQAGRNALWYCNLRSRSQENNLRDQQDFLWRLDKWGNKGNRGTIYKQYCRVSSVPPRQMNNTPGGSTTKRYNVKFNNVILYFTILGNLRIPEKQEQSRAEGRRSGKYLSVTLTWILGLI